MASNTTYNNYRRVRLLIGSLGMLLSFILPIYQTLIEQFAHKGVALLLPSISHYNYSHASVIFTGVLFAFGLLLISYRGFSDDPDWIGDDKLTTIAGSLAIVVALVPTSFDQGNLLSTPNCHEIVWLSSIHLGSAGLFLILLGIMSIWKFTKSPKTDPYHTARKRWYKALGWIVIVSIFILLVLFVLEIAKVYTITYEVIIFETTALLAFGLSWLLKGKSWLFYILGVVSKEELEEARGGN